MFLRDLFRSKAARASLLSTVEKAGQQKAVTLINAAILTANPLISIDGDKLMAGNISSQFKWNGDIQATLQNLNPTAAFTQEEGVNSLAVFKMACPDNGTYTNKVNTFHCFFRALGFDSYRGNRDKNDIPKAEENWYAHVESARLSPEYMQRTYGSFNITVRLDTLLHNLGIDKASYLAQIAQAQEAKARELKIDLPKKPKPQTPKF
jgi:hypothetical protein